MQHKIATPHMDRLAAEGMIFTDAHSSSSVCSPTRYGVMTGRYNYRTRAIDTFRGRAIWLRLDLGRGDGHHEKVRTGGAPRSRAASSRLRSNVTSRDCTTTVT